MPEDSQIGVENDNNFIGFSSRLDPSNLKPGFSQSSKNMRLQRGAAQPRKGCERLTDDTLNSNCQFGSGYYVNQKGEDNIVMLFSDGMVLFNTKTETFSQKYTFPTGRGLPIGLLTSQDQVRNNSNSYITVPTTIGISVGDTIQVGAATDSQNFPYSSFVVTGLTGTVIYYTDTVVAASRKVSLLLNDFSFQPEIVQALNNL
jgi:hypothetical protein